MRTIGAIAAVVGALELLNTVRAWLAGRHSGSTIDVAVIVVAAVAAILLAAGGVALLARPRSAVGFARAAAFICLLVFATFAALRPGFSIASLLLGIVYPIVMLVALLRAEPAHPTTARG